MKRTLWSLVAIIMLCLAAGLSPVRFSQAKPQIQLKEGLRPIDMMIVIDNSCSMFPKDKITPVCAEWGNDPRFLRITGADLFLARLGFGEGNEAEYQAGVVSLGASPKLVSPLQPLITARDLIAKAIANPSPEPATGVIPALNLAYRELRSSPNRRPTNLPAVVLITDGIPYPRAGQSNADIEHLISAYPDIPLFIMLLRDAASPKGSDYDEYIAFWQQMQSRYSHIFVYRVEDERQIEQSYNTIVAQLQNTVPTEGFLVTPGSPVEVFVSKYVQTLVVTVMHSSSRPKGTITIEDPRKKAISLDDRGVSHRPPGDNPVEVFVITSPRLSDDLKEDLWTIKSDAPVYVYLDRRGAYRVNFVEPKVSYTDINNVYLTTERQPASRSLRIRFNLLDKTAAPVTERQPIQGQVIYPDGKEGALRIPAELAPDRTGIYEFSYDFASEYPAILKQPGRFIFTINAGSADDRLPKRIPIATAQLQVDVGRGAYIATLSPDPVVCAIGQPANLTVTIGDYDTVIPDTVRVRVFGRDKEVTLSATTKGTFTGDLAPLCAALVTGMTCSAQTESSLTVRLAAQSVDGSSLPASQREVRVLVLAPACTPTPPPPPTPTPIPDSDNDGFNDLEDQCPQAGGWSQFNGCPPPLWLQILAGLLLLGLLALIIFGLIPWVRVHLSPPPKAYVLICRKGRAEGSPKSIYSEGISKRTNRVTIGSDPKKAHIRVKDLQPVEFVVERQANNVVILDAHSKTLKATFSDKAPSIVSTSCPEVTLRIGLKQDLLRC